MGLHARALTAILIICGAGCSRPPQSDLPSIAQARSVAAEWALVNALDAEHRLTPAYVRSMHLAFDQTLAGAIAQLSRPDSPYGIQMKNLRAERPDTAPDRLRLYSSRLKRIEDQLESA